MTFTLYEMTARQYNLNPGQMADLFVYTLDGPARTFVVNNVPHRETFHGIKSLLISKYNSNARQLQVKGILDTLRLKTVMAQRELTSATEELSSIDAKMEDLAPQCHPEFCSDQDKIGYLRSAVPEFTTWSTVPIKSITTNKWSFNEFVTALHESLQTQSHILLLLKGESMATDATHLAKETNIAQYTHNPRNIHRHHHKLKKSTPTTFEEARLRNLCFKCGDSWQKGHRCKHGTINPCARASSSFKR